MKLCDLKVVATLLQDEWETNSGTRHQILNVLLQYNTCMYIVMMSFLRYCVYMYMYGYGKWFRYACM